MASNQALKLQIARVKNTVLNGAMLQFANRPMANKTEAMEVLAEMVINGSITLEMIQAAPETAITAAESVDPALVQAASKVAAIDADQNWTATCCVCRRLLECESRPATWTCAAA